MNIVMLGVGATQLLSESDDNRCVVTLYWIQTGLQVIRVIMYYTVCVICV
jgi:hypothetical protein